MNLKTTKVFREITKDRANFDEMRTASQNCVDITGCCMTDRRTGVGRSRRKGVPRRMVGMGPEGGQYGDGYDDADGEGGT